jgi:hypothetical protein
MTVAVQLKIDFRQAFLFPANHACIEQIVTNWIHYVNLLLSNLYYIQYCIIALSTIMAAQKIYTPAIYPNNEKRNCRGMDCGGSTNFLQLIRHPADVSALNKTSRKYLQKRRF